MEGVYFCPKEEGEEATQQLGRRRGHREANISTARRSLASYKGAVAGGAALGQVQGCS